MSTLYWLNDDLRLQDNPALAAAAQDDTLTLLFCLDESRLQTDRFGNQQMGEPRWGFLRQALQDLSASLSRLGQTLNILEGKPQEIVSSLLDSGRFTRIIRSRQHTSAQCTMWQLLSQAFPHILFEEYDSTTLYRQAAVQFREKFPATFSDFRRSLNAVAFRPAASQPLRLPPSTAVTLPGTVMPPGITMPPNIATGLPGGGESAGREYLQAYFSTNAASTYKETRNQFFGSRYATGFSPWLALGCVSAVQIFEQLRHYESRHGANESTGWILFELMWREFFRWHASHHQAALFEFSGITGRRPLTSFYPERFCKWRDGKTPWPIVNACMNELRQTGLLSNRGRQIAASCLVNELGLDWRCGAGYFAQQLLDYDACSNWGNWQYIAGVGADPRGGRHFNLDKQAEIWDAQGTYRRNWAGTTPAGPLDSRDYYDWPIEVDKVDAP
jgi:deoxyribodipyrimidine photo-lyase